MSPDSEQEPPGNEPEDASQTEREGFDRWRTESAVGEVVTSVARGLRNVFAPPVDEPVIVASVPGEPPDADQRVQVILDLDDPTKSVAIVPPGTPEDSGSGESDG